MGKLKHGKHQIIKVEEVYGAGRLWLAIMPNGAVRGYATKGGIERLGKRLGLPVRWETI